MVKWLLIANTAVFFVDMFLGHPFLKFGVFAIQSAIFEFRIWEFITFQFLLELVQHAQAAVLELLDPAHVDLVGRVGGGTTGDEGMDLSLTRPFDIPAEFTVSLRAANIIVVEINPERRQLASSLGATHVIDPRETPDVLAAIRELSGGGVTHAMDSTGRPSVIETAFQCLLPGGMLGLIGVPPPDGVLTINLMDLLIRGVGVKTVIEGNADPQLFIPQMIRWYQVGKFPFDRLVRKFRFDQINEACHASETGTAIKPVLVMPAA